MTEVGPGRYPASLIVRVVRAYQRNWPHLMPPLFHADDVLPMLQGEDLEYETAAALLDADRVFHPAPKQGDAT